MLVGTTDTDFNGDRARRPGLRRGCRLPAASRGATSASGAGVGRGDIVTALPGCARWSDGDGDARRQACSREELILKSSSGMLSIAGGKLTTHRRIAERVVDTICRELGMPRWRPSPTLKTPLPGARPDAGSPPGAGAGLPSAARMELAARYGSRATLD